MSSIAGDNDDSTALARWNKSEDTSSTAEQSNNRVIILNTTTDVLFGFDQRVITLGANNTFCGLKDIPPGPHLVYAAAGVLSVRHGFWVIAESSVEVCLRWDSDEETLKVAQDIDVNASRQMNLWSMPSLGPNLNGHNTHGGAQSNHTPHVWSSLTSYITRELLSRVVGQGRKSWKVTTSDDIRFKPRKFQEEIASEQNAKLDLDNDLYFSLEKGSKTFLSSATGRDRTTQALDSTAYILDAVKTQCTDGDEDEIIGELQFSFLTGMLLGNVACQEQWSWTINTLFRANGLVLSRPVLVQKFIQTFHQQMIFNENELEGSIFDHDGLVENTLKANMIKFKARLAEQVTDDVDIEAVQQAFVELETFLEKELGWELGSNYLRSGKFQLEDGEEVDVELSDFEDEDERGEYAPVVVTLEDDGTQRF